MGRLALFFKVVTKLFQLLPIALQLAEAAGVLLKPGQKSGPEKLEIVRATIKKAIQAGETLISKDLVYEDLFDQGLVETINGTVKIWNSIRVQP